MLLLDVGDWSPTDRRTGCLSRSFSGADAGGALLKRRAPAKSTTSPHAPARAAESLQCNQDERQQCALGPAKSASRRRSLSAKTGQFAPRCAATPPVELSNDFSRKLENHAAAPSSILPTISSSFIVHFACLRPWPLALGIGSGA